MATYVNLANSPTSSTSSSNGYYYYGTLASGNTFTVTSGHIVFFYHNTDSTNQIINLGTIINNGVIIFGTAGNGDNLKYFLNKKILVNNGNIHVKVDTGKVSGTHCIYNYQGGNAADDTPQIINNGTIGTLVPGSGWTHDGGIINSYNLGFNEFQHGNYISNIVTSIYYNNEGTLTAVIKGTTLSTNGGCAIMPASNTGGSEYEITGDDGNSGFCDTFTLQGNFNIGEMRMSLNVLEKITYNDLEGFIIPNGITLTCGATNSKLTIGSVSSSFIYKNIGTVDTGTATPVSAYYSFSSAATYISSTDEGTIICFYGFVNVMTKDGLKQIKDLKRGDMIFTNDGYQPLAELDVGFNPSNELLKRKFKTTDFIVKIPKDFLAENVPTEDVYVTKTHPLSVRITSDKNDKDFEFLHLFARELMQLGDDIEYVRKDEETKLYNLIFDNHYEVNIGNMKFLSHHPNHNNGNKRLKEGNEIDPENRTKKVYADKNGIYFKTTTLEHLLKDKPENVSDKEFLASVLQF